MRQGKKSKKKKLRNTQYFYGGMCYTFCIVNCKIQYIVNMGREDKWYIQITDLNTANKYKQQLKNPRVTYSLIISVIESYIPEIDVESITLYYWKHNRWQLFLQQDSQDLAQNPVQFESGDHSNQVLIQVRFHCDYFNEVEQEDMVKEDLINMNEKITNVQKMYQELREKYIQQALDINVFWGSPLFTDEKGARGKKSQFFQNSKGEKLQILNNQVKYTPYINAIYAALQKCNNKKVHLYLKQLNESSFKKKPVFTITYIMAHVEVEEVRIAGRKQKFGSKTVHTKYSQREEPFQMRKQDHPEDIDIKEQEIKTSMKKQSSYQEGEDIQMIIEETEIKKQSEKVVPTFNSENLNDLELKSHSKSATISIQRTQSLEDTEKGSQLVQEEQGQDQQLVSFYKQNADLLKSSAKQRKRKIYVSKQGGNQPNRRTPAKKKPRVKAYLLGQSPEGGLCKIYPNKLKQMLQENPKIDLLILHTSCPSYHLQIFSKHAKNIILINSNPVYPQPSTIYYIKQLFIHLLQTGNIPQAYESALTDLNTLKSVSELKRNKSISHEYDESEVKFINKITEKWVHGSMECCCCYHPHHEDCHSHSNNRHTKFAEYHYMFHTVHCDCPRDRLMIHSCANKKQILQEYLKVLANYSDFKEYYFCCCSGYQLGYYSQLKNNEEYIPMCIFNQERDRHSLRYKYKYQKRMVNQEENQIEICDGKLQGDVNKNVIDAFKFKQEHSLIGNMEVIINLLEIFHSSGGKGYTVCNIFGPKKTGKKTLAVHFANLLVIKQLFSRIIVKRVRSSDSIAEIIEKQKEKSEEGFPFFIFIFTEDKYRSQVNVSQPTFGKADASASCIIITENKIKSLDKLVINFMESKPLGFYDGLGFVKMYRHLSSAGKKNLEVLFKLANRGFDKGLNYGLYASKLNQFQILNIVRKTNFYNYSLFQSALDRINKDQVHYYLFVMSIIKFTTSIPSKLDLDSQQKKQKLSKFKRSLVNFQTKGQLFFADFKKNKKNDQQKDSNMDSESTFSFNNRGKTEWNADECFDELINFERLRQHYYLIYACTGYKLKKHLLTLLKMFINYSTVIPFHKFNKQPKLDRHINHLRGKNSPFVNQIYEATSVNNTSYLSRYFKAELKNIQQQFSYQNECIENRRELNSIEQFLMQHKTQLQSNKRHCIKKPSLQANLRAKERSEEPYAKSNHMKQSLERSHSFSYQPKEPIQETKDIPNIYHLSAIVEAGLQFLRAIIGNHFIYSRLQENEKIEFLKFSILLINNCMILLKNKNFTKIIDLYEIDKVDEESDQNIPNYVYKYTHDPVAPSLRTMKSDKKQFLPSLQSRTFSDKSERELLYSQRQFAKFQNSAAKSNLSNVDEEQYQGEKDDNFLLQDLYRLSTYKGLLFLLAELEKRCDEITHENLVRTKLVIQLLGIQIRLEQLQLQKEDVKIVNVDKDRHLARIYEIFSEKNYNIITLKRILLEVPSNERFVPQSQELSIIKSHIIVALALMSSCYGRFKLVRGNFMIQDIDNFLEEWRLQIPMERRESQQEGGINDKQYVINAHKAHPYFQFLRLISQNESVYLHIVESFNSQRFWPLQQKNQELQCYQQMLRLFHLFTLKNTKSKKDFYLKLQFIQEKLIDIKLKKQWGRSFSSFSTFIHNFQQTFSKILKNQMNKLANHLILILVSGSDTINFDVKMSIYGKIQAILQQKSKAEYFCIKKKFNLSNLNRLANGYKCHYLFISTSTSKDNQKKLCIQNRTGINTCSQEIIVELLKKAMYKVLFICLPKKKNLAEQLISYNRTKRIVYFDFDYSYFLIDQKYRFELPIFQKIIMIMTISRIMAVIIDKESTGSHTALYDAFSNVYNSFGFVYRTGDDSKGFSESIILRNQKFQKCIFMQNEKFEIVKMKEVNKIVYQSQRIMPQQLQIIDRFLRRLQGKASVEVTKIELLKSNREQFMKVFKFEFKQNYSFDKIFEIDIDKLRQKSNFSPQKKGANNNEMQKQVLQKFYEKLQQQKILEYIFSNKKVILKIQFRQYDSFVMACEKMLQEVLLSLQQDHSNRKKNKFQINVKEQKKSSLQIFIYFFDYIEVQRSLSNEDD